MKIHFLLPTQIIIVIVIFSFFSFLLQLLLFSGPYLLYSALSIELGYFDRCCYYTSDLSAALHKHGPDENIDPTVQSPKIENKQFPLHTVLCTIAAFSLQLHFVTKDGSFEPKNKYCVSSFMFTPILLLIPSIIQLSGRVALSMLRYFKTRPVSVPPTHCSAARQYLTRPQSLNLACITSYAGKVAQRVGVTGVGNGHVQFVRNLQI